MTPREEILLLEKFKHLYENFPFGIISHEDAPDIIVTDNDYKIGIELTEIFQDSFRKSSKLKQLQDYHSRIGNLLVREIERIYNYKIVVHLGFNDNNLSDNDKPVNEIVSVCLDVLQHNLRSLQINSYINERDFFTLPSGIRRISVYRFPEDIESYYGENEGGPVADLEFKHIERIISKKEARRLIYKQCNEYWLVIKEGNYYAGTFNKVNIEIPIKSVFEKVFIVRTKDNTLIQLK